MTDGEFPDKNIDRTVSDIRRARDFDDLQNELADRDTGRNSRFLGKNTADTKEAQRRKSEKQTNLTTLQLLLQNDPVYAAQYRSVMDLLNRAETATEKALAQAEQDLSMAQEAVTDTLDRANKLANGTAIFKDKKGSVWTADGKLLQSDDLDGVVWNERAPSYEEYLQRKRTTEDTQRRVNGLRLYQIDVLGKSRDRMTDPNHPPSKNEMDGIEDDILSKAPASLKTVIAPGLVGGAEQSGPSSKLELPKL